MRLIDNIKRAAKKIKRNIYILYLACKDPRVPWHARVFTAIVLGYALSPVDIIPDFVPVFGYLDDLVLIPLGIILAMKMIPPVVLAEYRKRAQENNHSGRPKNRLAAMVIILLWIIVLVILIYGALNHFSGC